jgi:hypothetical protein
LQCHSCNLVTWTTYAVSQLQQEGESGAHVGPVP